MFVKTNVNLANKHSAFFLINLPCVPVHQFQAVNTIRSQVQNRLNIL